MLNLHDDEALEALRRAKPHVPPEETDPTSDKAHALKRNITAGAPARSMRLFLPGVVTATLAIGLAAIFIATGGNTSPPKSPRMGLPNIKLLAAASEDAFSTTGRATTTFVISEGTRQEERGTTSVSFEGDDLDMTIDFETTGYGDPGFTAHNRTVDGEFYLFDGAPGDRHWYHDTNASEMGARDLFNLDPRTLVELLGSAPQFVTADTEMVAGQEVRHLVAIKPDEVRDLDFGLGGSDAETKRFELWVGPDDVVRKVDIEIERTEVRDGTKSYIKLENGKVKEISEPDPSGPTTRHYTSTYSVSFTDIGDDIRIEAPSDPIEVAGKG